VFLVCFYPLIAAVDAYLPFLHIWVTVTVTQTWWWDQTDTAIVLSDLDYPMSHPYIVGKGLP